MAKADEPLKPGDPVEWWICNRRRTEKRTGTLAIDDGDRYLLVRPDGASRSVRIIRNRITRGAVDPSTPKPDYWIGWSGNYIRREQGYFTHAYNPDAPGPSISICGVKIEDTGGISIKAGRDEPGCIRCRRKLRQLGVLTDL